MVIIRLDADEAVKLLCAHTDCGRTEKLLSDIEKVINRYFPAAHIMDKEKMAEGYKEAGAVNLAIANGDQEG